MAAAVIPAVSFSAALGDTSLAAENANEGPARFTMVNTFVPGFLPIEKAQPIQFKMDPRAAVKDFDLASTESRWVTEDTFTYNHGETVPEKKPVRSGSTGRGAFPTCPRWEGRITSSRERSHHVLPAVRGVGGWQSSRGLASCRRTVRDAVSTP